MVQSRMCRTCFQGSFLWNSWNIYKLSISHHWQLINGKNKIQNSVVNQIWAALSLLLFLLQTTSPTGPGRSDSPVYTNLQELKISQSSLPPIPSGSPLHILGDWETHKDLSGRHFYYNRASGERTWKPPRTRDTSGSSSSMRGDSQGMVESEVREVSAKLSSKLWTS